MYFWTYGLQKAWLDKCLKSPFSEDSLTSNMVNGPKHCWSLNNSTFTIFIDPCESYSVWKSLSDWYAKYCDFLLTRWLSMTSILFLIERIYPNMFRCNYLRNQKVFLNFFFIFEIFIQFSTFSEKKRWPSEVMYFWTYGPPKTWLDKCLKVSFQRTLRQVTW